MPKIIAAMWASAMERLPKINSWVILCAMLRFLAMALLLLGLAGCAAPSPPTPLPQTETTKPPIELATFTPAATQTASSSAQPPTKAVASPAPVATPTPLSNFWQMLFPGAEVTQTDNGLVVLRHAPNLVAYGVLFEHDPEKAKQLSEWLDEAPEAMAGINCGFYWEKEGEFLHMGLLEVDEQRLSPVRAKWGSALVVRDGRAQIIRQPKKRIPHMTFGIQGWPTLLWHGKVVAALDEIDQGDMARRTAVGVDETGRVLWIVDNLGSTLREFAAKLQQADIGLVDAVNLDGGASTGLRWREEPGGQQSGIDSLPIPCVITLSPLN